LNQLNGIFLIELVAANGPPLEQFNHGGNPARHQCLVADRRQEIHDHGQVFGAIVIDQLLDEGRLAFQRLAGAQIFLDGTPRAKTDTGGHFAIQTSSSDPENMELYVGWKNLSSKIKYVGKNQRNVTISM
jgi:hypothetical protein